MKRNIFALLTAFSLSLSLTTMSIGATNDSYTLDQDTTLLTVSFDDVADSAWYSNAVTHVAQLGLMSGTGETTFSPNDSTTRGMVVTVLWRLAGSPEVDSDTNFPDVEDWYYYAPATAWATETGLTSGRYDGTFAGGDLITRQELAVFLYNFATIQGDEIAQGDLSRYIDHKDVSTWATDAFSHTVGCGLLTGNENAQLLPSDTVTRSQLAVVLQRLSTPAMG